MRIPLISKLVVVRKVVSSSMAPKLRPGQMVFATTMFRRLHPGQVVIVRQNHKELIKRIERIEDNKVFVIGDNLDRSIDSRQFGWLDESDVVARVFRPNLAK